MFISSRYHEMYIFDFVHVVIPLVDESVSSHGTFENYFNFSAAFSKKSNLIDWKRRVFKIKIHEENMWMLI